MTNETKIFSDTVPVVLYTMIDCATYGELTNYLDRRNIKWEFSKKSEKQNTIKLHYKGHNLFHDFEIVK